MNIKYKILILISFILGIGFIYKYILENEIMMKTYAEMILSDKMKRKLSKYLLPYREINRLKKANYILKNLEQYGIENDIKIKNSLASIEFIKEESPFKLSRKNLNLYKYTPKNKIIMRGIYNKIPGSAYLEHHNNNLFMISSTGILGYSKYDDSKLVFHQIKNNINDFIGEKQFYKSQKFSIKGVLISNNKIFISFSNEIQENCWNTSVISGKLNYKEIIFTPLFTPDECVSSINNKDKVFEALQAGGRIISLNKNEILLSTGEFRSRFRAQDENSIMGKLIKINLMNKKYEIIAMGTRNAQGLFYDELNKIIISTEHGPKGGDEINIISYINLSASKITNFGWAISSYGEHYLKEHYRQKGWIKEIHDPYIKYPLYKSHKLYGFTEPIKYYTPSIGISEIIGINVKRRIYAHASMADQSLYLFKLDEDNKIKQNIRIKVGERIRDMMKYKDKIILFLESTASIGIIDINKIYTLID